MKQTEFRDEDQMKVKLFDRIFKPQIITLENGNTVERPRSRMPLILIVLFVVIFWALRMTGFDLSVITSRFSKMLDLLKKIYYFMEWHCIIARSEISLFVLQMRV